MALLKLSFGFSLLYSLFSDPLQTRPRERRKWKRVQCSEFGVGRKRVVSGSGSHSVSVLVSVSGACFELAELAWKSELERQKFGQNVRQLARTVRCVARSIVSSSLYLARVGIRIKGRIKGEIKGRGRRKRHVQRLTTSWPKLS